MAARKNPPPRYPNTGKWKALFLATLKATCSVTEAAEAAGITRRMAYKARNEHPDFREAWDDAMDEVLDRVEGIMFTQAFDSDPKNTTARIFLLKAWRPDRYKETVQNELVGRDGGDVVVKVLRGVSLDDL